MAAEAGQEEQDIASRSQPGGAPKSAATEAEPSAAEAGTLGDDPNGQTPRVLPCLQGDVDFITAALSTYAGHEVVADIRAAWDRITGAIADRAAFRGERNAVAMHVVAQSRRAAELARSEGQ